VRRYTGTKPRRGHSSARAAGSRVSGGMAAPHSLMVPALPGNLPGAPGVRGLSVNPFSGGDLDPDLPVAVRHED
jgi:hypothetical protein